MKDPVPPRRDPLRRTSPITLGWIGMGDSLTVEVAVQKRTIAGLVNGLSNAVRMSVDNLVRSMDDALSSIES